MSSSSTQDDHAVEKFYEQMDSVLKVVPKKDNLMIGHWSAKVGPDEYQQRTGTVDKFCRGEQRLKIHPTNYPSSS